MVDDQGVVRYRASSCPVCLAEQVSRRLLESAAISPRHHDCDFNSFIAETDAQKAVLDTCREFADHFAQHAARGDCMVFSGTQGTGKNHLAVAIARTVLGMGRSVLQVTAHGLILRLRQTWKKNDDGPSEAEVLRQFAAADLLIIDEIGKHFGGQADEVHLFEVINHRYLDLKPTIVISNESPQGIEKFIGIAAYDRLCERGLLLDFNWPSYRRGGHIKA
jgi:DNA replication protein DnaC